MQKTTKRSVKAATDPSESVLEIKNDRGVIAPYSTTTLIFLFTPGIKNQYKLRQDQTSYKQNDFLIYINIATTLYAIFLTFRDTNKK